MFNLCRLCLKASLYHKHIYIGQSADSKPTYEVINYVYDLEICEGDGLPEYICRDCFAKLEEFVGYKKNAQKARSELVLLKWQLEKTQVKEEEDNCEDIAEERLEDLAQEEEEEVGKCKDVADPPPCQSGVKVEGVADYVNLIVCKTEPLDEEEEEGDPEANYPPEWSDHSPEDDPRNEHWTREDSDKYYYKQEAQVKVESIQIEPQVVNYNPDKGSLCTLGPPGKPPLQSASCCRENGSSDRGSDAFHLEGLGMKLQPEPSGSTLQRKKPGEVEVWNPVNSGTTACFPSSTLPGKYMYPCTICYKEFTSEHYLQKHYLTHRKDKTHRCSLCGEVFNEVAALRRHRNVHKDRKEMICVHCGKKFYIKSMLVVHMRAHTGDRPFKCERCGKGFAQNGNLQSHYLVHMRRDRCACQICGRTFLHEKHLSTHMALHSGVRPHRCELCGKSFAQPSVLKAHVAKHSGKNRFSCDTCGKTFPRLADKQRHEVVHGK